MLDRELITASSPIFFSGQLKDSHVRDISDTEQFLHAKQPFSKFPYVNGFTAKSFAPLRSPEIYLAGVNDAQIGTPRYLVAGKNHRVLADSIPTAVRRELRPGQEWTENTRLREHTSRLTDALNGPCIAHLDGVVAMIAEANNNFAHWHMDVLSSLLLLQELKIDTKVTLLTPELKSYRRRSLELLGVDFNRVREVPSDSLTNCHISCERLLFPSLLSVQYGNISFWQQRVFDRIARLVFLQHGNGADRFAKRVYVDRSNDQKRKCRNEAQLIERLVPLGFTILDPRDMEYDEEVLTYANADVIVGCMGAGLMNVLFARPGATMIELKPPQHHRTNLWKTCAMLAGARHHSILYHQDDGSPREDDSWIIPNVDATVDEIRRFL